MSDTVRCVAQRKDESGARQMARMRLGVSFLAY